MIITANEYVAFLNEMAKIDHFHLYDSLMETDSKTATIVRFGTPGAYSYEVLSGREESSVSYVNRDSAKRFCLWMGTKAQLKDKIEFHPSTSDTYSLSLIDEDYSKKISNTDSFWENIGSEAILTVTLCMMKEGGAEESAPRSSPSGVQNHPAPTLHQFRVAAENHPTAERFVIHDNGTIYPLDADSSTPIRNRMENIRIVQALRAAIKLECPTSVDNLCLFYSGMMHNHCHQDGANLKNHFHENFQEDESSDEEGKTSQESNSNRSSESSGDILMEKTLTYTQLEHAFILLQEREEKLNSARPDAIVPLNHSSLKTAPIYAIEKIEFLANQYVETKAVCLQSDHFKLRWCLKSINAAQLSISQYITAAECLLKAEKCDDDHLRGRIPFRLEGTVFDSLLFVGEPNDDVLVKSLFKKALQGAAKARKSAGDYYWQEVEASVLQNDIQWHLSHRFAWTMERRAESLENVAFSFEGASKASSLGHDSLIIDFWKKATEREKVAENYYAEALQALSDRNDSDWVRFTSAATAAKECADQFKNLAIYSREADDLYNGSPIAIVLRKALKKVSAAAEFFIKAEMAYIQNLKEATIYLGNAHKRVADASKYFYQAEKIRETAKTIPVTIPVQTSLDHSPSKVVFDEEVEIKFDSLETSGEDFTTYSKRLLEYVKFQATLCEDQTERQCRFHLAAEQYQLSINDTVDGKKYQAAQNLKLAELSAFASRQSQQAGDFLTSSAEQLLLQPGMGQVPECIFYKSAEYAIKSAASFRDAIHHWLNMKTDNEGVRLNDELFENSQTAAGLYARAARCNDEKQSNEASMLQQAAEAYEKKTKYYCNYYEAIKNSEETISNQEIIHLWKVIAAKCQLVVKHYDKFLDVHESKEVGDKEQAVKSKHSASVIEGSIQELKEYIASLSSQEAAPTVIYSTEREGSQQGHRRRITIIKTEAINLFVRHEEEFDDTGKKIGGSKMVADELLVRLKDNFPETQDLFCQNLHCPGAWLEKISNKQPLFVLHFLPKGSFITAETAEEVLNLMTTFLAKIELMKQENLEVHGEPNFFFESLSEPDDPYYEEQWNLKDFFGITPPLNLFSINNSTVSSQEHPIVIAVIDSGVKYDHEDLQNNMWKGEDENGDLINGFNALTTTNKLKYDPMDYKSHGTLVSGIIGAVSNNNKGIAGIAGMPDIVKLMPCLSSNQNREANTESIIKCVEFAREKGAEILNCSFGQRAESFDYPKGFSVKNLELLKEALSNEGKEKHVVVVCAAGNNAQNNDNPMESIYPASFQIPNLIAVAATSQRGTLAKQFSNYGKTSVHIAAPGIRIPSTTIASGSLQYECINYGTSFAAPHVSAALALLMAKFPNLRDNFPALIDRLKATADPLVRLIKLDDHSYSIIIDVDNIASGRLNLKNCLKRDITGVFGCMNDTVIFKEECQKSMAALKMRRTAEVAAIIAEFAKDHMLQNISEVKLTWDQVLEKVNQAEEAWRNVTDNSKKHLESAQQNHANDKIRLWWEDESYNAQLEHLKQTELKQLCIVCRDFSQELDAVSACQLAFCHSTVEKKI